MDKEIFVVGNGRSLKDFDFNYLKDKESKMVLYTYDSYLLDIHPDEISVLNDLKILIEGNGFPTKVEIGDTYSEMESVNIENTQR